MISNIKDSHRSDSFFFSFLEGNFSILSCLYVTIIKEVNYEISIRLSKIKLSNDKFSNDK